MACDTKVICLALITKIPSNNMTTAAFYTKQSCSSAPTINIFTTIKYNLKEISD